MMPALTNFPWRVIGAAVLAGALFAGGWVANGWRLGEEIAGLKAAHATEQRNQAYVQVKAVDQARLEEQRRTAAQTKATNEAIQQAEQARADARAADAARRELLARATALANASRRPSDSGAVEGGTATGDPGHLLANVLGRADAWAGELAQYADAARIAGLACERSYGALIKDPDPGQQ